MSDIGPIPAKDQTNFLLGRLEGSVNALTNTVAASAATQAQRDLQHEAAHAEFRRDIALNSSDIAVLKDNKQTTTTNRSEAVQKWMVIVGVPGALIAAVGALVWLLTNHP